jgi:hypothetical protein
MDVNGTWNKDGVKLTQHAENEEAKVVHTKKKKN